MLEEQSTGEEYGEIQVDRMKPDKYGKEQFDEEYMSRQSSIRADTFKSGFSAIDEECHLAQFINEYSNKPKPNFALPTNERPLPTELDDTARMSDLSVSEQVGVAGPGQHNIHDYMNKYNMANR